ncbi:hypothetical protein BH10BAC3_BH10BAC3_06390 [soil metagenome]
MVGTLGYKQINSEAFSFTDKCMSLFPSVCNDGYQPFLPYSLQSSHPDNLLAAVTTTLQVSPAKEVCFFSPGANSPEMLPLRHLDVKMPDYNLCIMPADGSWLLHHVGDKRWQWGKQHENSHLFNPEKKRFFIHWGNGGLPALKNTISPAAEKMETSFSTDDFRRCEEAFRSSRSDSFIYIIKGKDVWIEISMKRNEGYYGWQCITHDKTLLEPWRAWFNHY